MFFIIIDVFWLLEWYLVESMTGDCSLNLDGSVNYGLLFWPNFEHKFPLKTGKFHKLQPNGHNYKEIGTFYGGTPGLTSVLIDVKNRDGL